MTVSRNLSATVMVLISLVASGCSDMPTRMPAVRSPKDIRLMLAGRAATLLTAEGTFPNATAVGQGGRITLTADKAEELALSYLRVFGPYMRSRFEGEHGPIDFAVLAAGSEIVLVENPYEIPEDASIPSRKWLGPYYLVTVFSGTERVVVVAVSAYSTDIEFTNTGIKTSNHGNDFRTVVVSKRYGARPQLSAVDVVRRVYSAFGKRIDQPPRFIRLDHDFYPQEGNWLVHLEAPVEVAEVGSARSLSTDVVYLDNRGHFVVPAEQQLSAHAVYQTANNVRRPIGLTRRDGFATAMRIIRPR